MINTVEMIGVTGMLLVFTSFIAKNWVWLYSLNLTGSTLLMLYAILNHDPVFTILEAGIVALLIYRLTGEIRRRRLETRVRSPPTKSVAVQPLHSRPHINKDAR